ncbi:MULTISPECIES: nucleotidyltransferase family protein [unclassified Pseudomonas]|uniref:nucleotidyltransferase family protein n=1 Tax=unclassified Pseudomonas TaxID=196821 RepID=UPI0024493828|nr:MULTISPECIES: nucleotidyltransferase family protein [unclassified Pseudomonas]MDH0301612.1 nucleotidyltransferase family protein [Pseudomonas sp. GD04091]MDH1987278.1 nucleotidyltransferase family protein [Pseudomonas sp. GD03689]
MSVVALVLAAGQGSRFGADKRRALLGDGRSLLQHSVERALAVFGEVRVVLRDGERAEDLRLPGGCRIVASPDARLGMGHSLAAGVASLADSEALAVAIVLGDMPWIEPGTLRQLVATARASAIVVPRHQGQNGHPVLFGRDFWPELTALAGDEGARSLLQRHRERMVVLEVSDPGVLRDVDTPGALD